MSCFPEPGAALVTRLAARKEAQSAPKSFTQIHLHASSSSILLTRRGGGGGWGGADQVSKAAFSPLALYFSAPASFCSLAFHSSLLTAILSPSECPLGTVCLQGSEWLLSVIPQSLVGHLTKPASFY